MVVRGLQLQQDEAESRHQLLYIELEERGALSQSHWRQAAAQLDKELTKQRTMMHNRELISSDLMQELYQAGKAQRAELQQMMALFQQMAASRGGAPGRGKR